MEVENGTLYQIMDIDMDMADHFKRTPACWGGAATFSVNHSLDFVSSGCVGANAQDGDPSTRLAVRVPASQSRTPKAGLAWPCL